MKPIREVIEEIDEKRAERLKAPFLWKTGFKSLDQKVGNYRKGDIVVIGGRPGMGKTAFCLSTVLQVLTGAKSGIFIFSNQMCAEQIVIRLTGMLANVPLHKARSNKLGDGDILKLKEATKILISAKNLFVDDSLEISRNYIEEEIRKTDYLSQPLVIIDDFSQLVKTDHYYDGCENDFPEIEYVFKRIKRIAEETGAVFLLGVNLKRELEERESRRPRVEYLGENRTILNMANKVFLIYREAYYNREMENKGLTEIIIAKNDSGPTGSIRLNFNDDYARFQDPEICP